MRPDMLIDNTSMLPSRAFIKQLRRSEKQDTDSRLDWFAVGNYKEVTRSGGMDTTAPENVGAEDETFAEYNAITRKTFDDLLDFH